MAIFVSPYPCFDSVGNDIETKVHSPEKEMEKIIRNQRGWLCYAMLL